MRQLLACLVSTAIISFAQFWGGNPGTHTVNPTGGNTARLLNDVLGDKLNVKDFGAKGDGSTNDTAAINSAIAAMAVTGKRIIYFPAGSYFFTAPLVLTASNYIILGDGSSTLRYNGTTRGLVIGGGVAVSGVRISNLSVIGNATSGGAVAGRGGITIDGDAAAVSDITIDNVYVSNVPVGGIVVSGATSASAIRMENIRINGTGEHGIYLSGCANCRLLGIDVVLPHQDLMLASTGAAIKVSSGSNISITSARLNTGGFDAGTGILAENGVVGLSIDAVSVQIQQTNDIGLRIDGGSIVATNASINGGAGFNGAIAIDYRSNCSNSQVSQATVSGTWNTSPIHFYTGSTNCSFVNSVILAGQTGGYAFDLAGSTRSILSNNIVASGTYGVNMNTSDLALLQSNTIIVTKTDYVPSKATNYIIWRSIDSSTLPTLAGNPNIFTGTNRFMDVDLGTNGGGDRYLNVYSAAAGKRAVMDGNEIIFYRPGAPSYIYQLGVGGNLTVSTNDGGGGSTDRMVIYSGAAPSPAIRMSGNLRIDTLGGAGGKYVCVSNSGDLYANAACP